MGYENTITGRIFQSFMITYILTDWESQGLDENYILVCFTPLTEFLDWVTK